MIKIRHPHRRTSPTSGYPFLERCNPAAIVLNKGRKLKDCIGLDKKKVVFLKRRPP